MKLIIYEDWHEIIRDFSDDERLRVYDALFNYAFDGVVTDDVFAKNVTALMRKTIDRDWQKYNQVIEKRREAGRKGGLQKAINQQDVANVANAKNAKQKLANVANVATDSNNINNNNNINSNSNINNILINKDNNNIVNIAKIPQADISATQKKREQKIEDCRKRQEAFRAEVETFADEYDAEMLEQFFSYWSEPNKSQTKMRYEQQPTWELKRRLATWARNNDKYAKKKHYGTGTNNNGYIAPELRAAQERRDQEQRIAARIRQLAEEDGGGW